MATVSNMPQGNQITLPIRPEQVTTTEANKRAPEITDDVATTLAWQDYERARNYLEQNLWLLEWQRTDTLYQSPALDRYPRVDNSNNSAPVISRFIVAKTTNTMSRQVKKVIFAEQVPFFLRPSKDTTQQQIDAWTALIMKLLQRMDFRYNAELLIDSQTLQGTGIGKAFWREKTVIKKYRRRKKPPVVLQMPVAGKKVLNTTESDDFEVIEKEVVESWPVFEHRKLGWTLFDPKWNTPNRPDLSGTYCIDVDYVNFSDLQEMRNLECYKNIPDESTLRDFFFSKPVANAPMGTQVEQNMSSEGSPVTHAEPRNMQTSEDPLSKPLLLIERWTERTVQTLLYYDGKKLTIRNEDHDNTCIHVTANWWNIDNCGLGLGCGKLASGDQRINQGVLNQCLKMIAYPFNAPLLINSGVNAPTQNVIHRLGGFWQIEGLPPGSDIRKNVTFLETPPVPADAWHMIELSQQSSEDVTGANSPFMQGNLPGPGSSAARTATGASRIAGKADDSIAGPVDAIADGVITRVVYWLVEMVKEHMPLQEIRDILKDKYAELVIEQAAMEQFLNAEFEVTVLAGQKLATRQGIQQVIPFFMQIVQQPQLLQFLHMKGDTIDFGNIVDLFMQVADLQQQPDIIRPMNQREKDAMQQSSPEAQKSTSAVQVEQLRGQNKIAEVHAKAQDQLATSVAEKAMERAGEGIPLERAMALTERGQDENMLKQAIPQ